MNKTMRLAIISDVHANVNALRDALAQTERVGCDAVVCAGDLVDYGLFSEETIGLLRERRIPCIRGNHDRWAVGHGRADEPRAVVGAEPHDTTGCDLSRDALWFLAGLPASWDAVIEGVRVAVRHGTPRSDTDGIYPDQASAADVGRWLDDAGADVLVVGHTHLAFVLRALGGGLVVNPGAPLREPAETCADRAWIHDPDAGTLVPGPAPGGGTFGVLELPASRFSVHRAFDGEGIRVGVATAGVRERRAGHVVSCHQPQLSESPQQTTSGPCRIAPRRKLAADAARARVPGPGLRPHPPRKAPSVDGAAVRPDAPHGDRRGQRRPEDRSSAIPRASGGARAPRALSSE
jgi:putative phosphoesterase